VPQSKGQAGLLPQPAAAKSKGAPLTGLAQKIMQTQWLLGSLAVQRSSSWHRGSAPSCCSLWCHPLRECPKQLQL